MSSRCPGSVSRSRCTLEPHLEAAQALQRGRRVHVEVQTPYGHAARLPRGDVGRTSPRLFLATHSESNVLTFGEGFPGEIEAPRAQNTTGRSASTRGAEWSRRAL